MKYTDTLKNHPKKLTEKSTKKSLMDERSNKLLRLGFKSNNSIETRYCLHYKNETEDLLLGL